MRGENNLVPYRESILTRVFQTALTGCYRTGISLAVNVDTSPSSYEETKQVLAMFTIVSSTKSVLKPGIRSAIWISNNQKNTVQAESKQSNIININSYVYCKNIFIIFVCTFYVYFRFNNRRRNIK